MSVIDTEQVFKQLKKQNGEHVAKVVRDAVLLGVPNIVHLLEFAGNDPENIERLVPYIHENFVEKLKPTVQSDQDPITLLKSAQYDAFVVNTLEQQNSIKKYFRKGEELCTFNDPDRYKRYYIIHAVKENADEIQPSDNPQREDEYGTSVISIQIAKDGDFISIKNRYNHTLKKQNSDATFNNNPDNIVPGLTDSLKKYFHKDFTISTDIELPDDYIRIGDQLVYYNYEIGDIYYGSDYYVKYGYIVKLNTDHQIMMDHIILDTQSKQIKILSYNLGTPDAESPVFAEAFNGKNISIEIDKNDKTKKIISSPDGNRVVVKNGVITELTLPNTKDIGDYFLYWNEELKVANFSKLEKLGDDFLLCNKKLKVLNSPNLEKVGNDCLCDNEALESLDLPNLKTMGKGFLYKNNSLISLNAPKVTFGSYDFLANNKVLQILNMRDFRFGDYDNPYIKALLARTQLNNKQQLITNRQTKRNGR